MTDSRHEIRPPMATRPNEDGFNTATSGSETTTTTRIEVESDSSRTQQNDVTDKASRQHTTQAESDAVTTENKRNEFPNDKNADSPLRPHQRTNDVARPANLRQDAESIPNENDATDGNDRNSNFERKDDKTDSKNQGGDITVPGTSNEDENDAVDANKNTSPRGGKYNLRSNPNPNYSEEYRY